jgi:predicted small secreted protein
MKIIVAFIAMFSLTACNTIAGMGKDIQKSAEYTSTMMPEKKETVKTKEQ